MPQTERDLEKEFEEAPDLQAEFDSAPDLNAAFESAPDLNAQPAVAITEPVADTPAESQEKPDVYTPAEAVGKAFRTGATYLNDDEIDGVWQAGYGAIDRAKDRVVDAIDSGDVSKIVTNPIEEAKRAYKEYQFYRDDTRADNAVAAKESPFITGTMRVAGTVLNPVTYALPGVAGGTVIGGVGGFGASDGDAGDTAKSTLLGAGLGALGGRYAGAAKPATPIVQAVDKVMRPAVRYGLPVAGVTNAALSDDMTDADKYSAYTGGLLGTIGMASNFLKYRADKASGIGAKARSQISDKLKAADLAEDTADQNEVIGLIDDVKKFDERNNKAAVSEARKLEKEAWDRQNQEVKVEQKLGKLNNKESELVEKQALKAQQKALKDYQTEEKGVNKKFQDYVKQKTNETKARAKIRSQRTRQLKALEKAVQDAEAEAQNLDASAEGVYAQAFQNLANRSKVAKEYYQEDGLPVPKEVTDAHNYAKESYKKNTADKLVYPEQAKENFLAQAKANSDQKVLNARQALEQYKAAPFDENAEVAKLVTPVPNEEFYNYAKKLGLNPGKLEEFNPRKPIPLAKTAPGTDPIPTPEQKGLAKVEEQRNALLKPKPEFVSKLTDEQILKEAGLSDLPPPARRIFFEPREASRPPVDSRTQQLIDNAKPAAMDKVKVGAVVGAGVPMGVGGAASLAGGGGLTSKVGAVGGGLLAGAGAYVGARRAIKSLSEIDINTGKYKNPAAVAAVMDSISAVLKRYNVLDTKYGRVFRNGVTPVQAIYYIKNDPDLARALDEIEAESEKGESL